MDYITENEMARVMGNTGRVLQAEPRVTIIIGKRPEEAEYWEGGLNGYFFRIKRGAEVKVPESIAELIRENDRVTELARERLTEYTAGRGKRLG